VGRCKVFNSSRLRPYTFWISWKNLPGDRRSSSFCPAVSDEGIEMFYNFYTSSETSGISGLSRSGQFCRRKFCSSAKPSPETLWSSKLCRSRPWCSGRKRLQCSPSIFPSWSGNFNSLLSSFQDQFLQVVISALANKLAATGSVKICLCGSFINSHGRLLHLYQNN